MAQTPPYLRVVARDGVTAPDEVRGMTLEQWVEQNAERIWMLLRAGDVRDRSFNDVAEQLWSKL